MKTTVLASLATLSFGAGILLVPSTAFAASSEVLDPELTAVMGPAQEYQRGLTINGVAPTLRSVVVDGESILAYCIEYWVRAADPDHESAVTGWDEFTGDNNFKTDPQVRHHVAWILRHSYPTLSIDQVEQQVDTVDLSETEVITATQAAIWHFTDDFVPDGKLNVEDAPNGASRRTEHSTDNVQAVFDYLTGSSNTGLSEQEVQASVTLEDETDPTVHVPELVTAAMSNDDDHVFGPIRLNSSTQEVDLEMRSHNAAIQLDQITILDGSGAPVDLDQSVNADEVWVHVPAELETGAVQLAAESVEFGYTGRLIIPEPDGQRRFQTIMVVDQTTDRASTALDLTWEKPTVEEPEIDDDVPMVEPQTEMPPEEAPTQQPPATHDETPAPTIEPEVPETPEPVEHVLEEVDTPKKIDQAEPAGELATTGAHQTRNVLVGLGTLVAGACLVVLNRFRRART